MCCADRLLFEGFNIMGCLLGWLGWFVPGLVGCVLNVLAAHLVPALLVLGKGLFAGFLHACSLAHIGKLPRLVGLLLDCMCAHFVVWPCVALRHACFIMNRFSSMVCLLTLLSFSYIMHLFCHCFELRGQACLRSLSGLRSRWLLNAVGRFLSWLAPSLSFRHACVDKVSWFVHLWFANACLVDVLIRRGCLVYLFFAWFAGYLFISILFVLWMCVLGNALVISWMFCRLLACVGWFAWFLSMGALVNWFIDGLFECWATSYIREERRPKRTTLSRFAIQAQTWNEQ